jgi:hypothetical protein
MHAHIPVRTVQQHAQAKDLLALFHAARQDFVGAGLETGQHEILTARRREQRYGHDRTEWITFEGANDAQGLFVVRRVDEDSTRQRTVAQCFNFRSIDKLNHRETLKLGKREEHGRNRPPARREIYEYRSRHHDQRAGAANGPATAKISAVRI